MSVIKGVFSLRYVVAVWAGLLLLTLCLRPVASEPGWVVVNLHPDPWWESQASAVAGRYQGGHAYDPGITTSVQPVVWHDTASFTSLGSASLGEIRGMSGLDKVGVYGGRAALWQGADSTYVNLWPADDSVACATWGGWQVGRIFNDFTRASMWNGSAASRVNLHPADAVSSVALAIDGSGQAGLFRTDRVSGAHAALWQGSAQSVVDLHPAGAYSSQAQAIANGRQGGYVQFERDGTYYPAVWSGTAESFVNFSAPGAPTDAGLIYGMDGNVQVGGARFLDGSGGATIWFGTPESAFNLASLLSSDYTRSEARAVDIDEFGTIRVVGRAYNENYYLPNGTYYPRYEAMMWVLVPEPSSLAALVAGLAGLAGVRPRRRR